jgi:hypothetical protein
VRTVGKGNSGEDGVEEGCKSGVTRTSMNSVLIVEEVASVIVVLKVLRALVVGLFGI